ncbi:hypothetical protein [Nostoc sp.]|uniref:hypothetical protein n=1 Tax=Nostoc sp. TaxID=1180 RepID=UPI002FF9347F
MITGRGIKSVYCLAPECDRTTAIITFPESKIARIFTGGWVDCSTLNMVRLSQKIDKLSFIT